MQESVSPAGLSPILHPVPFERLAGWRDDDPVGAFEAFRRSAIHVKHRPYRSGALGAGRVELRAGLRRGSRAGTPYVRRGPRVLRAAFRPLPLSIRRPRAKGFVTGFYEPVAPASPVASRPLPLPALSPSGRSRRPRRGQSAFGSRPLFRLRPCHDLRHRRIFRPRRDRARRAGRAGTRDRLAGRPGRAVLHPCAGRGAAGDDRTAARSASPMRPSPAIPSPGPAGCWSSSANWRLPTSPCSRSAPGLNGHPQRVDEIL